MTCQYLEVVGPVWPFDEGKAASLAAALENADWVGESPDRAGFTDVRVFEPLVIVGYFAVEKPLTIVTYDEQREMHEHAEESFHHYWFGLFVEEGRLLAQRRRFDHRDLRVDDVLLRFTTTLSSTLGASGVFVSDYRPIVRHITKEEFLEEFARGGVVEIHIDSLHGRWVPDALRLYNPNVDRDAILKEAIGQDNQEIAELTGKAASTGDLSKTRFFRAELSAGEPSYIRRDEEGGFVERERTTTDRPKFKVTQTETRAVPTDDEIRDIVAYVKGLPRSAPRGRDEDHPTLFGEAPDD